MQAMKVIHEIISFGLIIFLTEKPIVLKFRRSVAE